MYSFPDFSSVFKALSFKKIVDSILKKNLNFLKEVHQRLKENIVPSQAVQKMFMASLEKYTLKEVTPNMMDYLSRMALRSLVGLPLIEMSIQNKDAIKQLEGSISWITEKEMDITEFLRKMREVE